MHAGPSAPRLAAPAPGMQTMTVDSPPMQVNNLYICDCISTCVTGHRDCRRANIFPGPAAFCVDFTSTN